MMNEIVAFIAFAALAAWLYLVMARGGFWRCAERDDDAVPAPPLWPRVVVVVPARNEAETVGATVGSLLRQDYPGSFSVVLVDDDSSDGTAEIARGAALETSGPDRLTVVTGHGLPSGWAGKLWALKQGIDAAESGPEQPDYLLLTDADIVHAPDSLRSLVARAEANGLVLTSLMAKLRCESFAERMLVPAFIFFFQMLYPFAWVNRARATTAGAAGGCMLVRAGALRRSGGIESIRDALIDDCALAARLKAQGPIWLGLTERVDSIRAYPGFGDIRRMIARSAYAQLRYSPVLLTGTVLAMGLVYIAPPLLAIFASGVAQLVGIFTWALMALSFRPTLRFYQLSSLRGIMLPVIALIYMLFTLDSAWASFRGRGGLWKGRVQASASGVP